MHRGGHVDVEQDEVRLLRRDRVERPTRILGLAHVIAQILETALRSSRFDCLSSTTRTLAGRREEDAGSYRPAPCAAAAAATRVSIARGADGSIGFVSSRPPE